MIARLPIKVPQKALVDFCRRNHIRRLSFFGSVVRDDFGPESDIDVLVEFEAGRVPGLITFCGMERELSEIFRRKVDFNTPDCFAPDLREEIRRCAQVQYEKA